MELTKTVALRGGTLEYEEKGAGRALVFVHGILADPELWRPLADLLAPRYRCILPRWPLGLHRVPFNKTADLSPEGVAGTVAEFLSALDLKRVVLVGNDSGGAVCQLVAADHRQRIDRLVLTNCDALEVFPPYAFAYLRWAAKLPGGYAVLAHLVKWLGFLRNSRLAYGDLSKSAHPQLWAQWATRLANNPGPRADVVRFARQATSAVTLGAADRLADFERPVLLLWGQDDRYFKPKLAARLAARLPNARVKLVADAKTFVSLDQPESCARAIERFVEEASEGRETALSGNDPIGIGEGNIHRADQETG